MEEVEDVEEDDDGEDDQHSEKEEDPVHPPSLWTATSQGRTKEVRRLLEEGAEDIEGNGGPFWNTPLCEAAYRGHVEILRLLLEHGAEMSSSRTGATPLHFAACHDPKRETVVQLLLDRGADVLSETDAGHTAEYWAKACGHHNTAAMLKAEALRRAQCEAFAMGHGERLGAGSQVRCLDPGVVRMVLERV